MIALSDGQIDMIMESVEPLTGAKSQEFLQRVAAALQGHAQITDDDVSAAVRLALRAIIHNSAVWKDWHRNSLIANEA